MQIRISDAQSGIFSMVLFALFFVAFLQLVYFEAAVEEKLTRISTLNRAQQLVIKQNLGFYTPQF